MSKEISAAAMAALAANSRINPRAETGVARTAITPTMRLVGFKGVLRLWGHSKRKETSRHLERPPHYKKPLGK